MALTADSRPIRNRFLAALLVLALAAMLGATAASAQRAPGDAARVAPPQRFALSAGTPVAARCPSDRLKRRQRSGARPRWRCVRSAATNSSGAPLYWGASIGDQLTGTQAPWDMNAVSQFEYKASKSVSLINFFMPFADCSSSPCSLYKFPAEQMGNIRAHGALPMLSWSSQSIPSSLDEPNFQLSDVIAGTYDGYIREFATAAKSWGHPYFLRFNWEMNGNWFSWSEGVNGNQTGEYVAAWRHVHDVFTSVGATNATWVWCPNIDPTDKLQSLATLYPGDDYVDWTGLDGYNWGPKKGDDWLSFNRLYSSTYGRITTEVAPSKPMLIGEVGSSEQGGSKAAWIAAALAKVPTEYPKIRGLLWFDTFDDGMDWPIETSASATEAFAGGIRNQAYRGATYADASTSPIAPPS